MSDDDRADRLRRRRREVRDRAHADETDNSAEREGTGETAKPGETEETGEQDETENPDESEETDEPRPSVKDEQKPTYMYLPHTVRRDLDRAYSILKAEYEYEYQKSFEKNRHFYPLVVSLGLDAVDELDPEEVRDRLNEQAQAGEKS